MVESSCLFLTATKIKKRCNQAVDSNILGLEIVLDSYKTHERCVDAVNTFLFAMQFVHECYATQ